MRALNLDRLRWGEWIAAIAACNLLLVTFRAWYKVSGGGGHVTAWDALAQGKYLLLATAVVGIFLFLVKVTGESQQLSFEPGWVTAAIGLACTIYIGYRAANPPSAALEADAGIYIALLSALGVTVGGLLSARASVASAGETVADEPPTDLTAPAPPTAGLVPDTSMPWNPATPAASTSGWSPATPAVAGLSPVTAANGTQPLRAGDRVVLTTGGARHPAGTIAQVVEVFGGGALVEVTMADGVADRFEVPEEAYERAPVGGATHTLEPTTSAPATESRSPALPAAAAAAAAEDSPSEKVPWWKREIGGGKKKKSKQASDATDVLEATTSAPAAESWSPALPAAAAAAAAEVSPSEKVPWWKREIGGGKKKKSKQAAELGTAAAAGAEPTEIAHTNGSADAKPSLLKRLIGGGKDEADAPREPDASAPTAAAEVAEPSESDAEVAEPAAESTVDEPAVEADGAPDWDALSPSNGARSAYDAADDTAATTPDSGADAADAAASAAPHLEPDATSAATGAEPHLEADGTSTAASDAPHLEADATTAAASAEPHLEADATTAVASAVPGLEADAMSAAASAERGLAADAMSAAAGTEPGLEADATTAADSAAPHLEAGAMSVPTEAEHLEVDAAAGAESSASEPEPMPLYWSPASDVPAVAATEPITVGHDPAHDELAHEEPTHVEADVAAGASGSDHGLSAPAALGVDHVHTQSRTRSSGTHKVPSELHAGSDPKPKVGDEVELRVGGGKYGAGTRGTVVDVFSAGVIVEVRGDNGRTERLDVPFEAIGPTDA